MSAGLLLRTTYQLVADLELHDEPRRDLLATLKAARSQSPLALLAELGSEAGLDDEELARRGAGLFVLFCAGNLADDLMDGECDYLESPIRLAPPLVYLLIHLGWSTLAESTVKRQVIGRAQRELACGAGAQIPEVRRTRFTFEDYQAIAEGIAGRQWRAYLDILTDGTPRAPADQDVGFHLGCAALVASDTRPNSPRWTGLDLAARRLALAWAIDHAERAMRSEWRTARRVGQETRDALRAQAFQASFQTSTRASAGTDQERAS